MKRIIILLVLTVTFNCLNAVNQTLIDSLEHKLANATNLDDSLRLSLDLFDASPRYEILSRAELPLALAHRAQNDKIELELLRRMAAVNYNNDSLFTAYYNMAKRLPAGNEKDLTMLYIKIRQNSSVARWSSNDYCRKRVSELINEAEQSEGRNLYTRIQVLFALCVFTEQVSTGELVSNHLEKMGELIDAMPEQLDELNVQYLTQLATTYTAMTDLTAAVKADKRLLECLDHIQHKDKARGRKYRNLSFNRYVVYRRLLGNYKALSMDEVEKYYALAKELVNDDPAIYNDFNNVRRPDMYYYMAHGKYAEAMPLLRHEIAQHERENPPYVKRQLLNYLFEAGEKLDNRDAMFEALMELREIESSEKVKQNAQQLRELQQIYDRNTELLNKAQLELEKRDTKLHSYRLSLTIGIVSLIILVIMQLTLTRTWRHTKSLNLTLKQTNANLVEERDTLRRTQVDLVRIGERARAAEKQKEEFINNMSHEVSTPLNAIAEYSQLIADCADESRRPYLTKFVQVVKLNTELLLTLVNDVLDLASIDRHTLKIEKRPIVLGSLASTVADTFKSRIQPGVKFINKIEPDYNMLVNTDAKRVSQVLLNLLVNAAKFTEEGTITLDGKLSDDGSTYEFSVTDTGIGIPEGKEEAIFNRFEKLNRHSQGVGLGLSVSRLVATLLGGEVKVDTSHRGRGARFIFTLPVKDYGR